MKASQHAASKIHQGEEGLITSNLDWNQRIASDLVTLCCTPTLASCCLLLATLYPARSSTT